MKKRLIAVLCLLALVIGIFALTATAADAETATFKVGYNRVDINPYIDPTLSIANGKFSTDNLMALPLRGSGSVWNRPSTTWVDDNYDGVINEEDGLAATCIAVQSGDKTILMITIDLIGSALISKVRTEVRARVAAECGVEISPDEIFYAGTHTHTAPDTTVVGDMINSKDADMLCVNTFAEGGSKTENFTYGQMDEWLQTWIDRTIVQIGDAAVAAVNDLTDATLTKDQLSASAYTTKTMNSTRHYTSSSGYYYGDNFNPRVYGHDAKAGVEQVTDVDDTIYLVKFTPTDGTKEPVILTGWRGHPSLNSGNDYEDSNKNGISSDYVNTYRYKLEEKTDSRVAFFQGTGGNVNPRGYEYDADTDVSDISYAWIDDGAKAAGTSRGNYYGAELANFAYECLTDGSNETKVAAGEIRTYQYILSATRQTDQLSDLAYYACEAAKEYYAAGHSDRFFYPEYVTGTYQSLYDEETKAQAKTYTETYVVASKFHANSIVNKWDPTTGQPKYTSDISVELNAILLGEGLAFVTAPGEPFDYYDAKGSIDPEDNDWLELNTDTYGKPFVLGYCNGAVGYIPNAKAYSYNEGSTEYATGSYEAHTTSLAQGTGEAMIQRFKTMLTAMSQDDYYYTAICEHCDEEKTWEPFSAAGTLYSGHYYLTGDCEMAQAEIVDGANVCLDLSGYTVKGDRRAFWFSGSSGELNIMDSSTDETGAVVGVAASKGAGSGWGGGTVMVAAGCELNLYGGTLRFEQQEGYSTANGGVIGARGTVNLYGGTVEGGVATAHIDSEGAIGHLARGGSIYVYNDGKGTGTLNIYGGTIEDGSLEAYKVDDAGTWTQIEVAEGYAYGSCVCVASGAKVNLYGTEASSSIAEIYFMGSSASSLTVHGDYRGTANLAQKDKTFALGTVVGKTARYNDVAADVSLGSITVGDTGYYAAVKGTCLVVAPTQYTYGTCEACGECQWRPMTQEEWEANYGNKLATGHYKLIDDVSSTQIQLNYDLTNPAALEVCVDIAGHTFSGKSRAFLVDDKATLNIMDSVGNGIVQGNSGSSTGGGVLYAHPGAEINLYSGTVKLASAGCLRGGVVRLNGGTMNMYGGTIIGGNVSDCGGAIYINASGKFIANGGQVTAGTAGTAADCIYVLEDCSVEVSGSAEIDDIYFASSSASTFTVKAPFTGSANLTYATTPEVGDDLGNFTGTGTLSTSAITVTGTTEKIVEVVGSDLILAEKNAAKIGTKPYGSLSDALAAYQENDVIVLLKDSNDTVKIDKTVYLDLNGHDIQGAVTVAVGNTLYGMDSATNDYTVEDGVYGKLTGGVSGDVQGVPVDTVSAMEDPDNANYHRAGYLKVTEEGGVSFHRLNLQLTMASVRPSEVGFYYTGAFKADEVVEGKVKSFGVALSVVDVPNAENLDADCERSSFKTADGHTLGGENTGTMLVGVMKTTNSISTNRRNAAMKIYGNAYVELTDDAGYIFGGAVSMSLQEMLETVDRDVYQEAAGVQSSAKTLYNTYTSVMSRWDVPNIKAAVAADKAQEEADTWKVLVLGNSHSLDATNMLYEVFQAENPDQKLVLGVLYRGGCKMDQHASYASTNTAAYTYYKNDGSAAINNGNSGWVKDPDSTMLQALQDEQWDVVVLQEMNTYAGISDKFEDNDIKSVINYVKRNTAGDPKFMWNLIWTNPQIPALAEGETDDLTKWIYQIQRPGSGDTLYDSIESWEAWYDYFDGDSWMMYNNIVSNVATYVEGANYNYGIEEVLTSGTAIQYAKRLLMEQGLTLEQAEKVLHRDYTHMNDYGRLIVSYLWYAQLMEYFDGENFDWSTLATEGLKYTDVPVEMLHDGLVKYAPEGMQITNEAVALNENIGADAQINLYQLLIDAVTYAIESEDYAVVAPQTAQ